MNIFFPRASFNRTGENWNPIIVNITVQVKRTDANSGPRKYWHAQCFGDIFTKTKRYILVLAENRISFRKREQKFDGKKLFLIKNRFLYMHICYSNWRWTGAANIIWHWWCTDEQIICPSRPKNCHLYTLQGSSILSSKLLFARTFCPSVLIGDSLSKKFLDFLSIAAPNLCETMFYLRSIFSSTFDPWIFTYYFVLLSCKAQLLEIAIARSVNYRERKPGVSSLLYILSISNRIWKCCASYPTNEQ